MINFVLASLTLLGPSADSGAVEAPPLKIWISNDRSFRPGNPVKVQVETGKSGYLLVLHFAPSGQVSVLFPVAPGDDNLVQADRRYEVRDGDGSVSFVASGSGPGLIYSALSEDPWQVESVTLNGGWDYGTLTIARDTKDPETDLTALVQRLSSPRGFDYDVLDYAVYGDRGADASPPPSWWSPAYNEEVYDCNCGGSTVYVGFGLSFGWPWYWYPYYAPYSYYGYYPGYGYPGYPYYPYYPYYPHHGGGYYGGYNKLVGRPRGYEVNPSHPSPHGRSRAGSRNVATDGTGVFADGSGTGRRARGGSDRSGTRGSREANGSGAGRPTENGSRGNEGTREATNPRSGGGDRGDRARARPSGRSGYSTARTTPNIERAGPATRSRSEWARVEDASPATSGSGARRVDQGTRVASNVPARGEWTRTEAPQARRTYRPEAPRRETFVPRPQSGGQARESGSGGARAAGGNGGGEARARGSEPNRGNARASGGNRSASTPSYAAPRGSSGGARVSGGGGGGGSRAYSGGGGGRGGGGGGGRARGGRP
jgi:hypothetical protein